MDAKRVKGLSPSVRLTVKPAGPSCVCQQAMLARQTGRSAGILRCNSTAEAEATGCEAAGALDWEHRGKVLREECTLRKEAEEGAMEVEGRRGCGSYVLWEGP